eukprot:scaffold499_cov335-Pavlova_lutheri.AAC.48
MDWVRLRELHHPPCPFEGESSPMGSGGMIPTWRVPGSLGVIHMDPSTGRHRWTWPRPTHPM